MNGKVGNSSKIEFTWLSVKCSLPVLPHWTFPLVARVFRALRSGILFVIFALLGHPIQGAWINTRVKNLQSYTLFLAFARVHHNKHTCFSAMCLSYMLCTFVLLIFALYVLDSPEVDLDTPWMDQGNSRGKHITTHARLKPCKPARLKLYFLW